MAVRVRVPLEALTSAFLNSSSMGKHHFFHTKRQTPPSLLSLTCAALWAVCLLSACGTDKHHFQMEGRFLNINQGEFYIYDLEGTTQGVDTIRVNAGRFAYETRCEHPATLMLVFPNFTEQPIFAQPGKEVDIKGDAAHLKEMTVTGTKENELMNAFRKQTANASPPEVARYARQFVEDHPDSRVSQYIVERHFLQGDKPDYPLAAQLVALMAKAQPDNGTLKRLQGQLKGMAATAVGQKLPAFTARDVAGNVVTQAELAQAEVAVVCVWASWDYATQRTQRQLKQYVRQAQGRLKVMGISQDASKRDCEEALRRDTIDWPTICDEQMMDGTLYRQLGFSMVPDNIVLQRGRIVARGLGEQALKEKIEQMIAKK